MDDLVKRLREVAEEKHREAWGRLDGGQDISISAMLAEEAAARIEELEAERDKAIRHRDNSNEGYRHTVARAERAEVMLKEAVEQAYAIGVYDQQNSAEKLDPAKMFPISGAATLARIAQEWKE